MPKQIHNAVVTRNTDPDLGTNLRGAIFFNAPTLFDGEYPLPAEPCFDFASNDGAGFFFVPKVNDEVEIEIEVADPNDPFDTTDVELPEPRWRCMVYSDVADIADEFKENYPNRMGWKTNSGHVLLFDDTEGQELIQLQHTNGNHILFKSNGDCVLNVSGDIFYGSDSATENLVLGNAHHAKYNVHQHIANLGIPSGFPIVTMGATELAQRQFTE